VQPERPSGKPRRAMNMSMLLEKVLAARAGHPDRRSEIDQAVHIVIHSPLIS